MFWRNKRKIDFSWVSSDSRFSEKITLNVLFDCNALVLASITVTDLQVVQKVGRYTTIHVFTWLVKLPQSSMMLRTNARKCQQISPLLNRIRWILLLTRWEVIGYGLVWSGKMARWFGLTIHQQSHLRGPSTAHGKLRSQVTKQMRIVLFWTLELESGVTAIATMAAMRVPMSFAKSKNTYHKS